MRLAHILVDFQCKVWSFKYNNKPMNLHWSVCFMKHIICIGWKKYFNKNIWKKQFSSTVLSSKLIVARACDKIASASGIDEQKKNSIFNCYLRSVPMPNFPEVRTWWYGKNKILVFYWCLVILYKSRIIFSLTSATRFVDHRSTSTKIFPVKKSLQKCFRLRIM